MRKFRLSVGPFAFFLMALIYILLGIAIPTTTAQAQKSYEFTAIAFLGDPAPGGGFFTFDFEPRVINSRGEVAFLADVVPGGGNGEGSFLATRGRIIQILRSGDAAPGDGTADAFGAWNTSLNDNGLSLPITNSTSPQMPNLLGIIYLWCLVSLAVVTILHIKPRLNRFLSL